jgi:protein O-GlcNAc transferase
MFMCRLLQGKLEEAVATYREAIAREPNFPEAYNNLGNALREAGRPDEAIACYTACIQLQLQRPGAAASGVRPTLTWPAHRQGPLWSPV